MTFLTAAALLAALQDDAAAAKLLGAAQDRIASAKTLRATIQYSMTGRGGKQPGARLAVLLKGESRWRVDVEGGRELGVTDASFVSDGRLIRSLRPGVPAASPLLRDPAGGN